MAQDESVLTQLANLEAVVERRNDSLLQLLAHIGQEHTCKCGAQIYLVRHKDGKVAPYNRDATNHFITCRFADEFRRKPK
jgi:hypothetical protein